MINKPKSGMVAGVVGLIVLGSLGDSIAGCSEEPLIRSGVRCTDPGQGSTGKLDGTFFPNDENRTSARTTFSTT